MYDVSEKAKLRKSEICVTDKITETNVGVSCCVNFCVIYTKQNDLHVYLNFGTQSMKR